MSLPTIPNINPNINLDRCDVINLLLSSIAMEEISLSHLLNAEGEKLQAFLKCEPQDVCAYLKMNESVNQMLKTVVTSQILLQFRLEEVVSLNKTSQCDGKPVPCKKPCQPCACLEPCPNRCKKCRKCKKHHKCDCP